MSQESSPIKENEKENACCLPNKITLLLRVMVGGYLVYTAWSLKDSFRTHTGAELAFFIIFAVLFALTGAFLLLFSGYALYKGNYAGGTMDLPQEERERGQDEGVQETGPEGSRKEEGS